jgi:hypothetical protein
VYVPIADVPVANGFHPMLCSMNLAGSGKRILAVRQFNIPDNSVGGVVDGGLVPLP